MLRVVWCHISVGNFLVNNLGCTAEIASSQHISGLHLLYNYINESINHT